MLPSPLDGPVFEASETIHVDAPPDRVFAFLDDPANHAAVTPSLDDVRDVEPLENGGKRLAYTFRLVGIPVDGELVQTVHDPPRRHAFELRGPLSGELSLTIEPDGEGSLVTYAARYEVPGGPLAAVARPLVRRYNRRELRRTLRNLRDRLAST